MRRNAVMILATLLLAATLPAGAATYPYTATEILGPTITVGTCDGWGLDPDPIGASSCATTTITRTASASDLTLTNSATVALGVTYTTSMDITRTAGSVTLTIGGDAGTARSTSDTFVESFTTTTTGAITLTFDADFDGTVTTTIAVQPVAGYSQYTPSEVTTPMTAPDAGGVIPPDAVEVVMSIGAYPIRFLYGTDPSATVGVLVPAGVVLKWGAAEIAKFRQIRFVDTAAGAATVDLQYSKGVE